LIASHPACVGTLFSHTLLLSPFRDQGNVRRRDEFRGTVALNGF
jgi:hypothetical protein